MSLNGELLRQAVAALKQLGAVLKVYGTPLSVSDLERMAAGGTADRKDDLSRLTGGQLSDPNIFGRLLQQFVEGAAAGKYPKGQAVELMGRSVSAPLAQRVVGTSLARGPSIAAGLQKTAGGAAFRATAAVSFERMFTDELGKLLKANPKLELGKTAAVAQAAAFERACKHLDAVMVQRLVRDTLRSSPVTSHLGMDGLRLLSPIADAIEHAIVIVFLDALLAAVKAHLPAVKQAATASAAAIAERGRVLQDDLLALDALLAARDPACVPSANASPISERLRALVTSEGYAGQVFRRVTIDPASSPQARGILALGALLDALPKVPEAFVTEVAAVADGPTWPPLKPEELVLIADRVFDGKTQPKDVLPGGLGSGRGPAKMILTLRGDWTVRTQIVAVCEAALRQGAPLTPEQRANVELTYKFISGIDPAVRGDLMKGLYMMATGDPDQRSRQIGIYLLTQASVALKPGLTLGPLRVMFAKYWRAVEAS